MFPTITVTFFSRPRARLSPLFEQLNGPPSERTLFTPLVWKKLKSCTFLARFLQNMVFLQASCKPISVFQESSKRIRVLQDDKLECQSCKNLARPCKSCKMINQNLARHHSDDNIVNSSTNC